jgi:autotransporter-associated beta strand protein
MALKCLSPLAGLFVVALAVAAAAATVPTNLFTPGNSFTSSSHYVSTTVFHWYDSTSGQTSGPWVPLEGRSNWTGDAGWWQSQVKQMMAANIDVIQVLLIPADHEQQRINLFQALHDLRAQGYNVPKVVPFLDTNITSYYGWTAPTQAAKYETIDLATSAGKDALASQYERFYNQYYSVNTDPFADSYIAQIDGRVVLDAWHFFAAQGLPPPVTNTGSLTRAELQSRLAAALSGHALFNGLNTTSNKLFMINSEDGTPLSFADEKLAQFEFTQYYHTTTFNGRTAAQVKAGYWDQNIRNPGSFLPRDGGTHYTNAWTQVQNARSAGLTHVNVESWNEYDEGSGIYAANPGQPYIKPGSGNTNMDTWSATNDPNQYIKTTAAGARLFNDTPDRDASILWNGLPSTIRPGKSLTFQVVVRNDGDLSWTGAAGYKFGEEESLDPTMFGPGRYAIDDTTNEIPTYGGIFRGRPITFDVQLTAPATPGTYTTHWRMMQDNLGWFGGELTQQIVVATPPPKTWNGGGGSAAWSTAANWVGKVAPVAGDDLIFNGPGAVANNDLPMNTPINSLSFTANAGSFTLIGSAIDLQGDISSASANNQTLNLPLVLDGGNRTISVATNGNITLSGAISQTNGTLGLIKTGGGAVTLSGANSYGGGTTIQAGRVIANGPATLGPGAVTLGGGVLRPLPGQAILTAGFGGTGIGWTVNNNAVASAPFPQADVLQLTDNNGSEARSAFFNTQVPVVSGANGFSASFVYTPSGALGADGAAFILQRDPRGAAAIGSIGGGLGDIGIVNSVSFEINLDASNTIGVNWRANSGGTYLTTGAVNVASGDPIKVDLNYSPGNTTLRATLTDQTTHAMFATSFSSIDVAAALGATMAYVGFSGATGSAVSTQQISNFSFTGGPSVGLYSNAVILAAGTTSGIEVGATASAPTITMGGLTAGSGPTSTLNVIPAPTVPANQAYDLTLGNTLLNGNVALSVANNGAGGGTLTLGGLSDGGVPHTINFSGPGTLKLASAAGRLSASTAVSVNGGTLELAGSVSSLSIGSNRVNITNNSSATAGILISGTNQRVGNVDGSGATQVNAGSDLTANHVIQSALMIGGTATSHGLVTIDPSDAAGNPLDQPNGVDLAGSLTPSSPFAAGGLSSASLSIGTTGSADIVGPMIGNPVESNNLSPVPEPSTLLLALLAVLGVLSTQFAQHHF